MKKVIISIFAACFAAGLAFQTFASMNMSFEYEDVPEKIEEGQRFNFKIGEFDDSESYLDVRESIFKIEYSISVRPGWKPVEYKSGIPFKDLYHMEVSLDTTELKVGKYYLYTRIISMNGRDHTDLIESKFEVVPRGSLPPSSKPESSPEAEKPANPNTGAYLLLSGASGAALLSAASAAVLLKRKRKHNFR